MSWIRVNLLWETWGSHSVAGGGSSLLGYDTLLIFCIRTDVSGSLLDSSWTFRNIEGKCFFETSEPTCQRARPNIPQVWDLCFHIYAQTNFDILFQHCFWAQRQTSFSKWTPMLLRWDKIGRNKYHSISSTAEVITYFKDYVGLKGEILIWKQT